jgi:hypothetical protein
MTFMITLNTKEQHRVQVHFFKGSGKWYGSATIDMADYFQGLIHECVFQACEAEFAKGADGDWGHTFSPAGWVQGGEASIVCIEPWHEHSHPIMIKRVP